MSRCKLPVVIVLSPALGGTALGKLPADWFIPTLADILPYAPPTDRSQVQDDWSQEPPARVGYDPPAVLSTELPRSVDSALS